MLDRLLRARGNAPRVLTARQQRVLASNPDSTLRSSLWFDIGLAAAVFVVSMLIFMVNVPVTALTVIATAFYSAALVFRRRYPMTVLMVCVAGEALHALAGVIPGPYGLITVIGTYSVAAYATRRQTLIGLALSILVVPLDLLRAAAQHMPMQFGGEIPVIAWITVLVLATALGAFERERRLYFASFGDRILHAERNREQQLAIASADERQRIARDMHDIVGHNISVMVILSEGAAYSVDSSPAAAGDAIAKVSETGREALTQVHGLLHVLNSPLVDAQTVAEPEISALQSLAEQSTRAGLPTVVTVKGDPAIAGDGAQLVVYRIVQEALTNSMRHAPAGTRVEVAVEITHKQISFSIVDLVGGVEPGAGKRQSAARQLESGGHGLEGMKERAALYGGWLNAARAPDGLGGWEVSGWVSNWRAPAVEAEAHVPAQRRESLIAPVRTTHELRAHDRAVARGARRVSTSVVFDIAVAAIAFLASVPILREQNSPASAGGFVLTAALCAALIWRREYPITVFAILFASTLAHGFTEYTYFADFGTLVAFYSVWAYSSRRGCAIVSASIGLLAIPLIQYGVTAAEFATDLLGIAAGLALIALAGAFIKTRRVFAAATSQRAEEAERERDQRMQVAAEHERERIAHDVDKVIARDLETMVTLADEAAGAFQSNPARAQKALREIAVTGRGAMMQLRGLVGVLRHSDPDTALVPSPDEAMTTGAEQ